MAMRGFDGVGLMGNDGEGGREHDGARRVEENLRGSREPDRGRQAGHRGEHGLGPTNGADDSGAELQAPLALTRFWH